MDTGAGRATGADAGATLRGGCVLQTPHPATDYPGLTVIEVPGWPVRVIAPEAGQTVIGRGGELLYSYELPNGVQATGFTLAPGDRATCVRTELPHSLAEWRIERATRR